MRLLITGGCGFVGSLLTKFFLSKEGWEVLLVDNFCRPGSEQNRRPLECLGATVIEADLRDRNAILSLPACHWVIDCAANPSVLAGLDARPSSPLASTGESPSLTLVDHNLLGTVHVLEYCKRHLAGLVLVSTSRVYSTDALSSVKLKSSNSRFELEPEQTTAGLSSQGISELFSTAPPLSLYGVTKLASEWLAREYAQAFGFPLWINRCGLMAGAGQFGRADQGIIAYWMHRYLYRHPLSFIGYGGMGFQVRDCLHPVDLANLISRQIKFSAAPGSYSHTAVDQPSTTLNVSGGIESAFSLLELHQWCERRWGSSKYGPPGKLTTVLENRRYDAPWIVLDSSLAQRQWGWTAQRSKEEIWEEIAEHAEEHPDWLQISQALS